LGENALSQGFDINIAGSQLGHPPSYFSPYKIPYLEEGPGGEYLTDRLTDEAIRFVSRNRSRPFFLHLAFYAVHTPLQPKQEIVSKYLEKEASYGQNNAQMAAMIENADENIGRFLDVLDRRGLSRNTIVLFTSDNGGVRRITSMTPLRAGKGSYYEGGIRVPLVIRWPGKAPRGSLCQTPVSGIDFYPTFLEMSGIAPLPGQILDGKSLVPLLTQSGTIEERPLFWHFPVYLEGGNVESRDPVFRTRPGSAVRLGDWKLHEYFEDGELELYNLKEDTGESNDLSFQYPEKAGELHNRLVEWRSDLKAPIPDELNPDYDENYDRSLRRSLKSKQL
jgi:arylsulfatase A-like enzyme